ncbi:MAG TPA: PilX N-terminal domain-containing pilus assembly protein [Verrucomicrobiaceae bacterium]
MSSQRGSALILAILMLAFLMVLGSAVLIAMTLDVAIGESYRSETQLLYLAESGIDEARGLLRQSPDTPSELLAAAAGPDGALSASRDLDTLLNATDDVPYLNGGNRTTGKLMVDATGGPGGRYYVFLRNDAADGMTSLADSNQILTLMSVAVIGSSIKVVEVTVMKWRFPALPAALVLNGSPVSFMPSSDFGVSGMDSSGGGAHQIAIGVVSDADRAAAIAAIPAPDQIRYPGSGNMNPPPADVGVIDSRMDPRLTTPGAMERIVSTIAANATDISSPGWNGTTILGDVGSSNDYRVVVVNGDCELGSGAGYGILLVRGNFRMRGNFQWNGLVLVIGQGSIAWAGAGSGVISGNVLVARTRANDRSAANELGTVLAARGAVDVNFGGTGNSLDVMNPGTAGLNRVNAGFPFESIAIREY